MGELMKRAYDIGYDNGVKAREAFEAAGFKRKGAHFTKRIT